MGVVCSAVADVEADPYKRDTEALKKADRLADSLDYKERVMAAEIIIGLESQITPYHLIEKLIKDENIKVRVRGFDALYWVCHVNSFSDQEVKILDSLLSSKFTRKNIDVFFSKENIEDDQIRLFVAQARALNSLYAWYSVVGFVEFQAWQIEKYSYVLLKLTGLKRKGGDSFNDLICMMLTGLYTAGAIDYTVPRVLNRMMKLPPDEIKETLYMFWQHPILGLSLIHI